MVRVRLSAVHRCLLAPGAAVLQNKPVCALTIVAGPAARVFVLVFVELHVVAALGPVRVALVARALVFLGLRPPFCVAKPLRHNE